MRWDVMVCAGLLPALGCVDLQQTAVARASRELACPVSELTVVYRLDVGDYVYDARGCGRVARYMCFHAHQSDSFCAREPNPDPAEEAARQAAPPPPEPQPSFGPHRLHGP